MRRIERIPEYSIEVRFDDNLIECYEKALELDPNYLIVKEELSKLHKKNIKKKLKSIRCEDVRKEENDRKRTE